MAKLYFKRKRKFKSNALSYELHLNDQKVYLYEDLEVCELTSGSYRLQTKSFWYSSIVMELNLSENDEKWFEVSYNKVSRWSTQAFFGIILINYLIANEFNIHFQYLWILPLSIILVSIVNSIIARKKLMILKEIDPPRKVFTHKDTLE